MYDPGSGPSQSELLLSWVIGTMICKVVFGLKIQGMLAIKFTMCDRHK